jgi:hypothetical protein
MHDTRRGARHSLAEPSNDVPAAQTADGRNVFDALVMAGSRPSVSSAGVMRSSAQVDRRGGRVGPNRRRTMSTREGSKGRTAPVGRVA